jgi:hypothetical protein
MQLTEPRRSRPGGEQRSRRGVPEAVDLVVDRRVLLDVVSLDGMYASGW